MMLNMVSYCNKSWGEYDVKMKQIISVVTPILCSGYDLRMKIIELVIID